MNVLVSGHGRDPEAVNAARRTVPYRRLILLSSDPGAEELKALEENDALANVQVDVRPVDDLDFMACLETARKAIEEHERETVRVHVAGGPNLLTSALLLAAFQKGVAAFYCHPRGVSHLPVAQTVDMQERFSPSDREVLVALPETGETPIRDVASGQLTLPAVKGALLRLRAKGLVAANHQTASLTPTGKYYRAHFLRSGRGAA